MVVFDLLTMIVDETDVSSDSEEEEALEWLFLFFKFIFYENVCNNNNNAHF